MTTTAWVNYLPDIPRILTAFAEWLACFVCILNMRSKMSKAHCAAVSLFFLAVQSVYMVLTDDLEDLLWILCMLGAVLLMYSYLRICTDVQKNVVICACAGAFITAEFGASFSWQIWCYIEDFFSQGVFLWRIATIALVFIPLFLIIFKLNKSVFSPEEATVSIRETLLVVVSAVLIFTFSNLGFLTLNLPFAGRDRMEIFNIRTLVDLGGLALLYAYPSQWKAARMKRELEMIQTILNSQYEQYKHAQRMEELINYRYHDLKNHIIALKAEENAPQRYSEYLDKLEHEIQDYEAFSKTGNQVLDTLLTSKNLRCMQHKIDMTCVIDGKLFDSMDVMDICSIFGNALDNAIECELKIQDYSKRMIHVDAFMEKSFLIIRFENYYEGDIRFDKGLPVTSKKGSMHGYGLKSLRYTVHKYKGEIQIDVKDHWFSLRILIPMDMGTN